MYISQLLIEIFKKTGKKIRAGVNVMVGVNEKLGKLFFIKALSDDD